ncbi:DUF6185 family protein [Streptomyces zaomyceticus]|uniref:DUF6185 family protein n=1 Tax=Streptomyces zaomyceticus TaxID=68286 RepID=UPI003717FAC7
MAAVGVGTGGLLLSVYQMRYHVLLFACLVAQTVAVIGIWKFPADPDAAPEPPGSKD